MPTRLGELSLAQGQVCLSCELELLAVGRPAELGFRLLADRELVVESAEQLGRLVLRREVDGVVEVLLGVGEAPSECPHLTEKQRCFGALVGGSRRRVRTLELLDCAPVEAPAQGLVALSEVGLVGNTEIYRCINYQRYLLSGLSDIKRTARTISSDMRKVNIVTEGLVL